MEEEQRLQYLAAMGVPVWVARDDPARPQTSTDSEDAAEGKYLCLAAGDDLQAGACWILLADRGELDSPLARSLKRALESLLDNAVPVALAAPASRLKPGVVTLAKWRQSQPEAVLALGDGAAQACAGQLRLEPVVVPELGQLRQSSRHKRECLERMLELVGASDLVDDG